MKIILHECISLYLFVVLCESQLINKPKTVFILTAGINFFFLFFFIINIYYQIYFFFVLTFKFFCTFYFYRQKFSSGRSLVTLRSANVSRRADCHLTFQARHNHKHHHHAFRRRRRCRNQRSFIIFKHF